MAIKLNELEPTKKRWGAPTADYPQGKFINGSGKGARDGSYAHANWANDLFGFIGAILSKAGVTPNGQVETARSSQVFDALKQIIKSDIDTLGGDPSAIASGSADAITATFTKPVTLTNGKRVLVRATAPNATASPTFAPNGLTAKTIAKGNGVALSVGDISGAGFWAELVFDSSLDKWILQNPATGVKLVLPEASETQKGIIQIASNADVANGTSTTTAVTPAQLKTKVSEAELETALKELIVEYGGQVPSN